MSNITRTLAADGVCLLTFDRPDSSANVFDVPALQELDAHLAYLEQLRALRGVILFSAKPKIFLAGADLQSLTHDSSAASMERTGRLGQQVFTRLERLPVPSVAAIHGLALGGGLEVSLACDWRVASNDSGTKLGLPETMLGILPGWGGSVRLPRLIGLPAALGLILPGKQVVGTKARKLGLVDEVVAREQLLDAARRLLARGKRRPAATPWENRPVLRAIVARQARKQLLAKTRGLYPAPLAAIDVATRSLGLPLDAALDLERAAFVRLTQTPECQQLMRIFFLQERAKKLAAPGGAGPRDVERIAVVGAGVMGAGIAHWSSARGLRVLLQDIGNEPLARGLATIRDLFRGAAKRRSITEAEAMAGMDRVVPTTGGVPLPVDVVVEAAVEKLEAKRSLFQDLERRAAPHAVLATNTSALSIDAIAEGLRDPSRVVGIHFFNPVARMQLVEVVRGERTSDAAVATALGYVKRIGKLPVLVADRPGFLVNRVLTPYMTEAVRLFLEGVSIERIDAIMLDFGMPMGPLRLVDEVGLDIAQHVATDLARRLPHPVPVDTDLLQRLIAKNWLGRKTGRGFYVFPEKKGAREQPNAEVVPGHAPGAAARQDDATRLDRMTLLMVNEGARCLEEGVVAESADVDFGLIFGAGWAPFRGGPLRYADSLGIAEVVRRLEHLAATVAPYFAPCQLLVEMGRRQGAFYSEPTSPRRPVAAAPAARTADVAVSTAS
ncbi:3-hydroxyacyl-CoA dehydrogenase NAD-binding domain-containing protein [Opitutus sp. ER46]|uniref:3-hydroxyacyl-CoA dehydrogenase NAD-binding domain-containing protein n=1 Tax=Opitutus sp. ER46 TaxID=2161864 RepID=UPI000D3187B2|nr:3-hydroxyacyl-CoA dehydrogenase NAD-binding domain-containing protein [Opitutus sp. ER46]PTX91218.1 fatty acid oxidation complex subunit alpha FadJ [Opitutus sp. ER46]